MTRIVLDGWPLQARSAGVAVYVRELLAALVAQAPAAALELFGARGLGADDQPVPTGVRWRRAWRYPLVMGVPPRVPQLTTLESVLGEVDCFHATAYAMPRTRRTPVVLTVHDLTLLRHPQLGTPDLCRTVARVARQALAARLVIADSQATAADLRALCGVAAERIRVVPLGVAPRFRPHAPTAARAAVAARFRLDAAYLLHVGTLEPRKNLPALIAAWAPLWKGGALTRPLVLAGAPAWGAEAVERAIADADVARHVIRLGRVDDADLPALYAAADACVVPSLDEGFGLSLAQAMACGTPVLSSNAGALPEVAGAAALLLDPADADAWRDGVQRLLAEPELRARLAAAGPPRAAAFTWQRTAQLTRAVYEDAIRGAG